MMGVPKFLYLSYCLSCCFHSSFTQGNSNRLRLVREWSQMEFVFPSEMIKQDAIAKQHYVPGNSVPIDVEVHHRKTPQTSRIFVTFPRFDVGRPITLGIVDNHGRFNGYPDYFWHANQGTNCEGMTSVFRVAIDKCNRLWVADTGKIGDNQTCSPQLLAFNLDNDQLIFRHRYERTNYYDHSLTVTPVVDVRGPPGECQDTFVYVADVTGFGIIVVDVVNNRSWRVNHKHFYPYPNAGTFSIDGESFDLMDGVIGMALSPPNAKGSTQKDRLLYFHSLASLSENFVWTSMLRNSSFIDNNNAESSTIGVFPEQRRSQAAAEAIDENGIMYFGQMNPPSIYCWNTATDFAPRNFHPVAVDPEKLQFASGVKVVNNAKGEQELWVLTCSFQRVMTGSINSNRSNFRIHAEKLSSVLKDSPCMDAINSFNSNSHAKSIINPNKNRRSWTGYRYGVSSHL